MFGRINTKEVDRDWLKCGNFLYLNKLKVSAFENLNTGDKIEILIKVIKWKRKWCIRHSFVWSTCKASFVWYYLFAINE